MKRAISPIKLKPFSITSYGLQWASVTIGGFLLSLLWLEIGEPPDLGTIQGTIGGAVIGLGQALILSRWLPQAWLWMVATLIAWGLMAGTNLGAIGWIAPRTDAIGVRLLVGVLFGSMAGLWVGVWQWLVLRQKVGGSHWWIGANAVSWGVGLALGWLIGGLLRSMTHLFLGEVIGLAIAWMIVGTQTGLALGTLLAKHLGDHKRP